MTETIEPNKTIQRQLQLSILYFYGSYGIFYVIALLYRLFLPTVTIPFVIAELNKQVQFTMDIAELLDLIFLGIIFSIYAFFTFNRFSTLLPQNKKIMKVTRILFMISIIILNFGVISHMVANQLGEFMHAIVESGEVIIVPGSNLEQLELGLYFWDEIASHIFTGWGIFGLITLFLQMERKNNVTEIFTGKKDKLLRLLSFAVGGGIAFGLIEGQAGAIFFVVSGLLLLFTVVQMIGTKYKNKPFTTCTLIVLIGYILFTIIYVLFTGLKSNYPYIKQISEFADFF